MASGIFNDDILDISFQDLESGVHDNSTENNKLSEVKAYEKRYLIKSEHKVDFLTYYSDEQIIEIFSKVVFCDFRRCYIENLSKRSFDLENTRPYQIEIRGHLICDSSWGSFLSKAVDFLLLNTDISSESLLAFRSSWSKTKIFTLEPRVNSRVLVNGMYLNCNHTALHSCWLLQELLDFFKIDKSSVLLLIHRPCSVEPRDVREYISNRFECGFRFYLITHRSKTVEQADKVIRLIKKYLNPLLAECSNSYTDFFLFDDNLTLFNYIKEVRKKIDGSNRFDDKARKTLNKFLNYLDEFYKLKV